MQSITKRWLRGSLLISVLVLALAEGLFLSFCYQNLYGGVESAMLNRFSTLVGRLHGHRHRRRHRRHRQQPRPGAAPGGGTV